MCVRSQDGCDFAVNRVCLREETGNAIVGRLRLSGGDEEERRGDGPAQGRPHCDLHSCCSAEESGQDRLLTNRDFGHRLGVRKLDRTKGSKCLRANLWALPLQRHESEGTAKESPRYLYEYGYQRAIKHGCGAVRSYMKG